MRFLLALVLLTFLLVYFLFRGKAGFKNLKFTILAFTGTAPGKVFCIAAITSMIALLLMLLTGMVSIAYLIELYRKIIELCPFCLFNHPFTSLA